MQHYLLALVFILGGRVQTQLFFSLGQNLTGEFSEIFLLFSSARYIMFAFWTAPDLTEKYLPCAFGNASTPMHLALGLNPNFTAADSCECVKTRVLNSGVPVCYVWMSDNKSRIPKPRAMVKLRPLSRSLRWTPETYGVTFGWTHVSVLFWFLFNKDRLA